jgi:hypothetical protein
MHPIIHRAKSQKHEGSPFQKNIFENKMFKVLHIFFLKKKREKRENKQKKLEGKHYESFRPAVPGAVLPPSGAS